MSGVALKVPPLLLVLVTAALMWLVAKAMPELSFMFPVRWVVAATVVVTGGVILLLGFISFRRAGTTVNPMNPQSSTSLVVSGIYARTRNPMYLGFLLVLLAWAIVLSNVPAFLFLPAFVLYLNRFQIIPEERALASIFGQDFAAYTARVRRWI